MYIKCFFCFFSGGSLLPGHTVILWIHVLPEHAGVVSGGLRDVQHLEHLAPTPLQLLPTSSTVVFVIVVYRVPCTNRSKWTLVVEEVWTYANRLRSTQCLEFLLFKRLCKSTLAIFKSHLANNDACIILSLEQLVVRSKPASIVSKSSCSAYDTAYYKKMSISNSTQCPFPTIQW